MKTIAIANQKGGVGKTTTTVNLGIGLAKAGKKVLLIDFDAQGSLTESLGFSPAESLATTIATKMTQIMEGGSIDPQEGILQHPEGISLMPANIELSGMEVSLVNVMSRETILKEYVEQQKGRYDYILIDCTPSLGMLTINALAAADGVIIPVQAQFLPLKGLEQLIKTIGKVKRQINPRLQIEGVLMTMVDQRTNFSKEIVALLKETYGEKLCVFENTIPVSVRLAESSVVGKSIYAYDKNGKGAAAYEKLTGEVLRHEKPHKKHKPDFLR